MSSLISGSTSGGLTGLKASLAVRRGIEGNC